LGFLVFVIDLTPRLALLAVSPLRQR